MIVVLLMAAVLLMLGLAFAARTTEQVFLSTQEEDTTRVFNVAESGIDQALYNLDTNSSSLTPSGQVNITQIINESAVSVTSQDVDNAPVIIEQGQTLTIKPGAGGAVGSLKWTTTNATNGCPGLLITLYQGASAYHVSFNSAYSGTDCTGTGRNLAYNPGDITGYGDPSGNTHTLDLSNAHFGSAAITTNDMIRVTPLYGPVTFTQVKSKRITSTATDARDGTGATETRKIEVTRTEPGPPSVFDYAVFSGGDLVKN